IGQSDTTLFIAGIQNGFRTGSKIVPKPVTSCDVTLARDCWTWGQQFSKCAISCGIAMCRRLSNGTHTVCKIVKCVRSACAIFCLPRLFSRLNDSNPHEMEMTKTGNGVSRLRCVPAVKQLVCFRAARPSRVAQRLGD